jgi:hypothetical protein
MTKKELPEVRIKYAWLLREAASIPLNELWGDGRPIRSDEEYQKITEEYDNAWQPYKQKILSAMTDKLELAFYQKVIDVYIAPWFAAFSDPMVIGVTYSPDRFVDVLTHEILHRLLTDNTSLPLDTEYLAIWQKLFGKSHTCNSLVHIPVHAMHKYIYLEVLKDRNRLARDVENNKRFGTKDYLEAWDYVDKQGYNKIIEKLKQSYKND